MSGVEVESIQESSQLELEYENAINENGLIMIFENLSESDRAATEIWWKKAVTESIEPIKSVTPPSSEWITKDWSE